MFKRKSEVEYKKIKLKLPVEIIKLECFFESEKGSEVFTEFVRRLKESNEYNPYNQSMASINNIFYRGCYDEISKIPICYNANSWYSENYYVLDHNNMRLNTNFYTLAKIKIVSTKESEDEFEVEVLE